jgi:sugar/nucleoside kinase (ribokinase family)
MRAGSHHGWESGGAAASNRSVVSVPAFRASGRHTHCAAAAFSGGLLYGLMQGWHMQDCLELAAASGAPLRTCPQRVHADAR